MPWHQGEDGGVTLTAVVRVFLGLVGVALIWTAVVWWGDTGVGPKTTVTEKSVPMTPAVNTVSVVKTITIDPGGKETTVTATTTTPVTGKMTTTVGPTTSTRSEAILLALIGIAVLFLLLALFGDRIKSIGAAGISIELAEKTETVAKALDARLKSIEGRLNNRPTKAALVTTNAALVQLTARVTALEQGGKPPQNFISESRRSIEDQGVVLEVEEMAEPDDAGESQALQADIDAALADLHQSVEALKNK